ncbi:protein neprosin-like [Vitis vinifera]|uniref:protein neprosin-like n=1 Tax=Vitis vinifera TaxID=29760 RepID=UPI0005401F36|nr:protein neprosin-like [Vitis vinifera]|eukprot:XP_010662802.1 PREDICTED: uncharacterized protein LOC104882223 [Vitis vinifera]
MFCWGSLGLKMRLLLVGLALFFLAVSHEVEGGRRRSVPSKEDLELEREVRRLNKPAVKSIKTTNNDIFDCVDINKQPAFDNPLLQNLTVQLAPSGLPKGLGPKPPPPSGSQAWTLSIPDGGCPPGTVPIERTTTSQLKKMKSFFQTQAKNFLPADDATPGYHVAATRMALGSYLGAQASVSIHQEPATDHQNHRAMVWVSGDTDYIQVGWMVNKGVYGDGKTRFFTMWTADNFDTTGCMNTYCPGFVQVNSKIPLSINFDQVSTVNGTQYDYPITIFQDQSTLDWWLIAGPNITAIGYWPKELFPFLKMVAIHVEWGGYLYKDDATSTTAPQMGSGLFPEQGYGKAAYFKQIQIVQGEGGFVDPPADSVNLFSDRPQCYKVGPSAELLFYTGYHFYYGGPGGDKCNP